MIKYILKIFFVVSFFIIFLSSSAVYSESSYFEILNSFTGKFDTVLKQENFTNTAVTFLAKTRDYNSLVKFLRQNYCPVGAYRINISEDISKLDFFMAYLKDLGFVFAEKNPENSFNIFGLEEKTVLNASEIKVLMEDNTVISYIPSNIWLETHLGSNSPDFFIIYTYHDEDFSLIDDAAGYVINKILSKNKKPVYIDELGLIPEESVKREMKIFNISEEEAFYRIKQAIFKENQMLEKGIPLNVGTDSYRKFYKMLAEKKVKSIVEDLKYENWKNIIQFDKLPLIKFGSLSFLTGNFDKYIKTSQIHWKGFWEFNIDIRDEYFVQQILESISSDKQDCVFFTVRGIGHYGLQERLENYGIKSSFIVLGNNGSLEDNIDFEQKFMVYSTLKVNFPEVDLSNLILKAEIHQYLTVYLCNFLGFNLRKATYTANQMCEDLSSAEVKKIANVIKENLSELKNENLIYEFVYKQFKNPALNKP